jgi:hypothetical protein
VSRGQREETVPATPARSQKRAEPLELGNRLALRPAECAASLGISERTLRGFLPEIPHTYIGSAVVIPTAALQRWLDERSRAQVEKGRSLADEVLAVLESKSKQG